MSHPIYPCLWFDGQAQEAAKYYCSFFKNANISTDNGMVVIWELEGFRFMGLNGDPQFKPNPSVSFFITCESKEEVDQYWKHLSDGGQVMMPLDTYSWSEYYGFVKDKFGIAWQIYKGDQSMQKIIPCLLFTDEHFGQADNAIKWYQKIFKDHEVDHVYYYPEDELGRKNLVEHAQFTLNKSVMMAMDGKGEHHFEFNEAISFVISCDTQEEIDHYWNGLTEGGEESMCGWLKDAFGVSWQVVPSKLGTWMNDPEKGPRVIEAFMKMRKFDIQTLLNV